jgi:tRNA (guanine10-N2)-methyltransferase
MGRYLIRFAQVKEDFRLEELRSICSTVNVKFPEQPGYSVQSPFWTVCFENDKEAKKVLERAILVKEIVALLAEGNSLEELLERTRAIPEDYYAPYKDLAFKFTVDDYMQKISISDQVALINRFSFMPLSGPVSMNDAKVTFSIHCDSVSKKYYLGRFVGLGRRDLIDRFNLKKRDYLGTTSMDSELSLVMCNLARISPGNLVYDPFVGTGSLLCTSAFFGGFPLGSDIDGRQMRGSEGRSILSNMVQYKVADRFIGGCVFDILQHPWREGFVVDAILTDPPYGVRAGAKKIGTKYPDLPTQSASLSFEDKSRRYPKTIPYEMDALAVDLHNFAKKFLRIGGRLVYWYPIETEERSTEAQLRSLLPIVDGIDLVSVILQRCKLFDRWLVTFERTASI